MNLSFALNYAVGGTAVWSYHAVNLAIHALAALTLFGVVRRTLRRTGGRCGERALPLAAAAALLWAVHPVQTASVTYVSQRAESLMALWYLLTLYSFIRWTDTAAPRRAAWAVLAVLACLLGMATKEVMVTAPLVVLLYDRVFVSAGWRELWRWHGRLHGALTATWLPLLGLLRGVGDRGAGYELGIAWWRYALLEGRAVTGYLKLAVWPHPLVFDYGLDPADGAPAWPYVSIILILLGLAIALLVRRPRAGFAALWFFVLLAPTSSVVPVAFQPMAENRPYLPLAGLVVLAVTGLHALLGRAGWWVLGALAAGGMLLTVRRNEVYRSELALWRDTVAKRPASARAHNNLGTALEAVADGRPAAIAEYRVALRLQPDYAEAHVNLGNALARQDELTEAMAEYEAALRIRPGYAEAHNNLGGVLAGFPEQRSRAAAECERALRLNPDYTDAHFNLAVILANWPERRREAVAHLLAVRRLAPETEGVRELLEQLQAVPSARP